MIHLLDSIADAEDRHRGGVAVTGSHGGLISAARASRGGFRAAIFNDAGVGKDEVGVAGVVALGKIGVPAAAVDCMSARIGEAEETLAGVVSMVNTPAMALRVTFGMRAEEAARRFAAAGDPEDLLPAPADQRAEVEIKGNSVLLVDSSAFVTAEDDGRIIVTGSHGGVVGGDPDRALMANARLAVFNDAGMGKDRAGVGRLPALDRRGVAAVAVGAMSARIGSAESTLEAGVISAANLAAAALGAEAGTPLREFLEDVLLA